jgi:hypothetical protein
VHAPGFDCTLVHDCRQRLLAHEAGPRCLATFLATCKARGWSKARGTQRTASTHGLAAIRTLQRGACVLAAMPDALPQLSAAAPAWGPPPVPLDWDTRYGLRSDQRRRPKDARPRAALARQMGADGSQLLDEVWAATRPPSLRTLPALEALRQMWVQPYDRWSLPGMAEGRWRSTEEHPPAAVRRHLALRARGPLLHDTRHAMGGRSAAPHGDG